MVSIRLRMIKDLKKDPKKPAVMALLAILDCEVDLVVKKKRQRLRQAV